MSGFFVKLEEETLANSNFRKVLYTAPHSQLVLMSLKPSEDIGMEVHPDNDQFIRIDAGHGQAVIDGEVFDLMDGSAVVIPAGSQHNIINLSATEDLKLYTVYSPAHHPEGTIHPTKADAMAAEAEEHA